jgi:hypothetical protein
MERGILGILTGWVDVADKCLTSPARYLTLLPDQDLKYSHAKNGSAPETSIFWITTSL